MLSQVMAGLSRTSNSLPSLNVEEENCLYYLPAMWAPQIVPLSLLFLLVLQIRAWDRGGRKMDEFSMPQLQASFGASASES